MSEVMGDIVIYTTADVRSNSYAIRQRLLGGAVETLKLLLERDEYDQIIIVGHSLGTLIAYDALNRIILDMNVEGGVHPRNARKLAGFVTFGSPLDKVAFFFREHMPADAYVRRQILAHLHGLKSRPFPGDRNIVDIDNPIQPHMKQLCWLNFYHERDPVSGHLDAYDVDQNILCAAHVKQASKAHVIYWIHDPMYEAIGDRFFKGALDAFLVA
jgi:pimeloyl-ACP methyl ester carboxylesterase